MEKKSDQNIGSRNENTEISVELPQNSQTHFDKNNPPIESKENDRHSSRYFLGYSNKIFRRHNHSKSSSSSRSRSHSRSHSHHKHHKHHSHHHHDSHRHSRHYDHRYFEYLIKMQNRPDYRRNDRDRKDSKGRKRSRTR